MTVREALRRDAREIFGLALAECDAAAAVRRAVSLRGTTLRVLDTEAEFRAGVTRIYSVAVGKAAAHMAAALEESLGGAITGGVVSAPPVGAPLPPRWRVYAGGHPLPNSESIEAARASLALLREADRPTDLVIFLVSGGGSAMIELPRGEGVTLDDLREANRVLVSCGASIAEVNAVRRALSAVKGGGLAAAAPRAPQLTLIISDTERGREADVASGPTLSAPAGTPEPASVVEKYDLAGRLPASVERALRSPAARPSEGVPAGVLRKHYVLLDNLTAVEGAARAARGLGYEVGVARDLVEQEVSEGAAELVSRLSRLYAGGAAGGRRGVCLVSGGEFACAVRGAGVGGRNAEAALRCAFEFEARALAEPAGGPGPPRFVALCAGTDGVDGNSPAAGALADDETPRRARLLGMDPKSFLDESDAYTLFDALGDAVVTGPTGTNVRDLRVLLAA